MRLASRFFVVGFVLIVAQYCLSPAAAQEWNWTEAASVNGKLSAVAFADSKTGVVVGEASLAPRTTDGGKTWAVNRVRAPDVSFDGVAFADGKTVVAAGDGAVWRSTDAGRTWTQVKVPEGDFDGVAFLDAEMGVAVGGNSVLRTMDGGQTWSTVSIPTENAHLRSVDFADETTGVAVGYEGRVLRTTDGGETWVEADSLSTRLISVRFSDAKTGVAVNEYGAVIYTRDGGQTWKSPEEEADASFYRGVGFASPKVGIVAAQGHILRTTDGGRTWSENPVTDSMQATQNQPGGAAFASRTVGVAAFGGSNTTIMFRTEDGGKTWGKVDTLESDVRTVNFVNETVGVAGGKDGTLYRTTDGGKSWTRVMAPADLRDVAFANSEIGVAVGGITVEGGKIFRTTDAGETWTQIESPVDNPLVAVGFATAEVGMIAGREGHVLRTTDGGETWHDIGEIASQPLAVAFADDETGVIVGRYILRTTNAGQSGRTMESPSNSLLWSASFASSNIGIATGREKIYRTSDAGQTWTEVGLEVESLSPAGVAFADEATGVVVARGQVVTTEDAGETWSVSESSEGLVDVDLLSKRTAVAITSFGGIIMRGER